VANIAQLLDIVLSEGPDVEEAALELGLILERGRTGEASASSANAGLTHVERAGAIDELIAYVSRSPAPHPTAVWALTQSHERQIVQSLIALLDRIALDPAQTRAAYNALTGIINIGLSSKWREESLRAIRSAARHARGEVRQLAADYLRIQGLEE
jgi:hypothetical protein